jgi:CHRD domain
VPPPRVRVALPLLLVAALAAACGTSGSTTVGTNPVALDEPADGDAPDSARLGAELTGAAETPGPGDPDGRGSATVVLEPARSQLCYRIDVSGVNGVDGTALHRGSEGQQGAVVLGLDPPDGGSVESCVTAERTLLERVRRAPERYYLNVRSDEHPDGALRGQLAR